ncbi:UNVERIFIED_CONTAM: hypothetical protein Sradi_4832700 [Sesamum radiatum]|uniref:Uncharacterized protein n=1 Tax=Sesamum radiatum TaxID=300843 RepID=A0AAW2MZK0_SESRA
MAGLSHSTRLARREIAPPLAVRLGQGVKGSPHEVVVVQGVGIALLHSRVFHGQCPPPEHLEFKTWSTFSIPR